jgi:hypothetical protein
MRWAWLVILVAHGANAAKHPRFEPTDLEMENPGISEIDLQVGPIDGQNASRMVMPDFELDLGILEDVELDLDGTYAIEGGNGRTFFDHQLPDNLWPSVKVALGAWKNSPHDRAWAMGMQVGPKIPIAPGASGIGVEGLLLMGVKVGDLHGIINLGGLVDPHTGSAARPTGFEAGLDLQYDLVPDRWAVLGELGGIYYTSADAHQLAATAGIQYSINEQLDVSVVALVGFAAGSDPFGVLFGVSPKLAVW